MLSYLRKYSFAPKWYFILATSVLCGLFIYLGCWQLQRAAEKKSLQAGFSERLHLPPVSLQQLPKGEQRHYYPLKVVGFYDNLHSVLLDNKIHDHQVGYEVVTPLRVDNDQRLVLVNRGWIPAGPSRAVAPVIPQITAKQTLVGHVYIAPGKSLLLGHTLEPGATWPLRMQVLDIRLLEGKLHQSIYPFVLLLSPEAAQGFVRDWQPVAMPAQKHLGYAVQWFAFALVLLIIFMVVNIRKMG